MGDRNDLCAKKNSSDIADEFFGVGMQLRLENAEVRRGGWSLVRLQ
jgi:hypothetical protein